MTSLDPRFVAPTLVEAVRALADRTDRGYVFVRPDGTERFCSFRDVGIEAERRAADFHARGLKKGDRIAICVPDPDEFVLSFVGAVMGGIVPVPISPQLSFKNIESYHDTVAHITKAAGAKLLLTTPSTRQYVDPVA
jgi:fatty-acyl-CoA synthase